LALDRAQWDKNQLAPWTGKDLKWVDIVVNNIDFMGHPFHLVSTYFTSSYPSPSHSNTAHLWHGFDFFILAQCYSVYSPSYNPFASKPSHCGPYNLVNPPKKDTVYIPATEYLVLRFRADNEGIWVFHCHILWHHAGGMLMAFQVMGSEDGVLEMVGRGGRLWKVL
jgi:FtsP/CotA-like multicopper oxidase with cupredoxin domain